MSEPSPVTVGQSTYLAITIAGWRVTFELGLASDSIPAIELARCEQLAARAVLLAIGRVAPGEAFKYARKALGYTRAEIEHVIGAAFGSSELEELEASTSFGSAWYLWALVGLLSERLMRDMTPTPSYTISKLDPAGSQ
jgi:hypothetical protein